MALGRLHPSDEYDIRIAVEEGEGGSLDGKWIAMLVDEIEHFSGENARLQALLAERDAEVARLRTLAEYAQHDPGCYAMESRLGEAAACKCGFYEARAALAAAAATGDGEGEA